MKEKIDENFFTVKFAPETNVDLIDQQLMDEKSEENSLRSKRMLFRTLQVN